MFYVYIYRDPSRGNEPIYVGKGQDDRAYKHMCRKDRHPFTQRLQSMKRNGIEPDIEIIRCNNEEVAFAAEVLSIKVLGRKDLGKGSLLNLTDGGEGTSGWVPTAETRKNMSDALKGRLFSPETRQKLSDAAKGKTHSPETRQKLSEMQKGKSISAEHRKKISEANKGTPKSAETRQKLSMANKGKLNSAAARQKMSEAKKGIPKPRMTCPHCGKEGGGPVMKRHHFDKCKSKKET